MAGTVSNIALSQQFDGVTGRFLSGGKLYFYQANTTTPQSAYIDTGLTIAHPNPITLNSAGRVPMFYLEDGSIRVRLVNRSGVVQFDEQNLLVIGPSSGGGGGGTAVDPTTIFQIGDTIWLDVSGVRSGWVRDNGRTIGSSTSGASERANSDCEPLFLFLWQTYPSTVCPVLTGRGATAAADWAANKQITLPDKRGYIPGGLDDMGNSAASRFGASVPITLGGFTVAGGLVGETLHTTLVAELPASGIAVGTTFTPTLNGGQAALAVPNGTLGAGVGGSGGGRVLAPSDLQVFDPITLNMTTSNMGSGTAHNNVQRTVLGTFYRKL